MAHDDITNPPAAERPRNKHTVLKVLLAILALYLVANLALAALGATALSLGLVSCMASCSDSPIGDTKEATAFISDTRTNDRDLATFDALRGCIDSVHDKRERYAEDYTALISVDEYRAQVAAGTWPDASAGYGDVTDANNPQLWVRIAELAQDLVQMRTDERWDVVDIAYPFPDNGPIPAPATRGEDDNVKVLLVCRSGADEGLFATVDYWRWKQPAIFTDHIDEARQARQEALDHIAALQHGGLVADRDFLLAGSQLFIWAQADEEGNTTDPLCDPQAFTDLVNAYGSEWGGYADVTLLAPDTPPALDYSPLSTDYPNERETRFVSLETCQAALASGRSFFRVDHAEGDALLTGYCTNDRPCTVESLRGALLPGSQDGYLDTWFRPTDDAAFDDALLGVVQQSLGASDEQIIALSALEQNERGDAFLRASVIVERGLMPETPEEFCAASNRLLDDVCAALAPQVSDGAESSLYLHIYVAENDSVTHNGKPSTFAELREAAQTDVMSLDSYSFVVALGSYPSCSLWADSTEPIRYDCDPYQVDGTIARSREWRYDSDTE